MPNKSKSVRQVPSSSTPRIARNSRRQPLSINASQEPKETKDPKGPKEPKEPRKTTRRPPKDPKPIARGPSPDPKLEDIAKPYFVLSSVPQSPNQNPFTLP